MKASERLRDDAMLAAFEKALTGDRASFIDKLRRGCGLPGPRPNFALVKAIGWECAAAGDRADALIAFFLSHDERLAPHGHVDEILPMCAIAGLCAQLLKSPDHPLRAKRLEALEEACCDSRGYVRQEVSKGLALLTESLGDGMRDELLKWLSDDQPYLACAAVDTLAMSPSMSEPVLAELLDAAMARLEREHRAGRRHEAYKRLERALGDVTPRLGAQSLRCLEVLVKWAGREDENARAVLERAAEGLKQHSDRAAAIRAALKASKKPSRDPRWDRLPGKRGRGR